MLARLLFLSDAFLCHPVFHSVEANENIEGRAVELGPLRLEEHAK